MPLNPNRRGSGGYKPNGPSWLERILAGPQQGPNPAPGVLAGVPSAPSPMMGEGPIDVQEPMVPNVPELVQQGVLNGIAGVQDFATDGGRLGPNRIMDPQAAVDLARPPVQPPAPAPVLAPAPAAEEPLGVLAQGGPMARPESLQPAPVPQASPEPMGAPVAAPSASPAPVPSTTVGAAPAISPQATPAPIQGTPRLTNSGTRSTAGLITRESGGRWDAQNDEVGSSGRKGHFGRIQFGQDRLDDFRRATGRQFTTEEFLKDPELQMEAEDWHWNDIDSYVATNDLERYVGSSVNGVPVTREGLRQVAHLGGRDGMKRFLQTGGQYNPADANGTTLIDYLAAGAADEGMPSGRSFAPTNGSPSEQDGVLTMGGRTSPEEKPGFWGQFKNFTQDKSDELLAIGAGLLSSGDWSEGIGNAAANLGVVGQQNAENDLAQQRVDASNRNDGESRRIASTKAAPVRDNRTGDIIGDAMFSSDPNDPGYFRYDDEGNKVKLRDVTPITNTFASGSGAVLTGGQAMAASEEIIQTGQTLESFDKLIETIPLIPTGINGFVSDLQKMYSTLISEGITDEQIARGDVQGRMQELIGQTRLDVVGPGVMTEQDALRVLMALGGDMKSILSNPEIAVQRLSEIRGRTEQRYNHSYEQYETMRRNNQQFNYNELPRYQPRVQQPSSAVPETSEDIDAILKGYDL